MVPPLDWRTKDTYAPVTVSIVRELCAIVGEQHVIHGDPERLEPYSHDEVAGAEFAHLPEVVVKPGSATEISEVMRLAHRERIPVTPRGAGSGLSGGAIPLFGGILLSVERMDRILEIDRENMVVVVEPGVVTNDINEAVEPLGLFYAGYPMSVESCFVGGNVAENAGGGRAIKYGVTGHYVLGLEVVLPSGRMIELGGKRVKDVTGYDLLHLMVGSEGTLGIFTRIILRLLPVPGARTVLLVPFADVPTAVAAVPEVMTQSHLVPASVEFMDRLTIETAYDFVGEGLPHPEVGALLLIEIDGSSREQLEGQLDVLASLCLEAGALDVFVGSSASDERRMWRPRQMAAEAFKAVSPVQSIEDIVVPLAQIPELMAVLERLSSKYGVLIPCYGHAGDGNLHVTPVKPPEMPTAEWRDKIPALQTELYRAIALQGGTISGEHGVGSKRTEYLPLVLDPAVIELQRGIKRCFDPLNILNPGKIFRVEAAEGD